MTLPNQEQTLALVRWGQATFGPIVVSHGYATSSNWEILCGIIISLIPLIWGIFAHTETATVAAAAKIASDPASPVKGVVIEQTVAGTKMLDDVLSANPKAVIAQAGSLGAEIIAKPSGG